MNNLIQELTDRLAKTEEAYAESKQADKLAPRKKVEFGYPKMDSTDKEKIAIWKANSIIMAERAAPYVVTDVTKKLNIACRNIQRKLHIEERKETDRLQAEVLEAKRLHEAQIAHKERVRRDRERAAELELKLAREFNFRSRLGGNTIDVNTDTASFRTLLAIFVEEAKYNNFDAETTSELLQIKQAELDEVLIQIEEMRKADRDLEKILVLDIDGIELLVIIRADCGAGLLEVSTNMGDKALSILEVLKGKQKRFPHPMSNIELLYSELTDSVIIKAYDTNEVKERLAFIGIEYSVLTGMVGSAYPTRIYELDSWLPELSLLAFNVERLTTGKVLIKVSEPHREDIERFLVGETFVKGHYRILYRGENRERCITVKPHFRAIVQP